jgi:hypothetical protein
MDVRDEETRALQEKLVAAEWAKLARQILHFRRVNRNTAY